MLVECRFALRRQFRPQPRLVGARLHVLRLPSHVAVALGVGGAAAVWLIGRVQAAAIFARLNRRQRAQGVCELT